MISRFPLRIAIGLISIFYISCADSDSKDQMPAAYSNPTVSPYTEKIKLNPNVAEGYFERAQALANIQSDSLAIEDFRKSISIDENNPLYLQKYADFLFEVKRFADAAKVYEQLYTINNNDESVLLSLIQVYIRMKDAANARKHLDAPLKELPDHPILNYLLSEVLLVEKDTVSAMKQLDNLIQKESQFYAAKLLRGEVWASQLNPNNVKELEATFRLDTLDVYPLERIGDYYYEINDLIQALNYYKKAVTADLNYEYGFYKVGQVFMKMDSLERAVQQYNLAIQANVRYLEPYIAKAKAFESLGNKDSAIAAYELGLTFHPQNETLLRGLKRLEGK